MKQWEFEGMQGADLVGCGRLLLIVGVLSLGALLASCAGTRSPSGSRSGAGIGETAPDAPASRAAARRGGGYYLDDGPGDSPPPDLDAIADAVPQPEPVLARTSRPYVVFGRQYQPMTQLEPYRARGIATWYGRRYHGNPTSSGERYDMYAMTAAHPTLPIPSYVRVSNVRNGRSVVVRVNDRGPFLSNRLIDLSYTAAAKLGYVGNGSAEVDVELITDFGAPPVRMLATANDFATVPITGAAFVAPALSAGPIERPLAVAMSRSDPQPQTAVAASHGPESRVLVAALPGSGPQSVAAAPVSPPVPEIALPEAPSPDRLTIETDIRPQPMDTAAASSEPPGATQGGSVPPPMARPLAGSAVPVPVLDHSFWLQLGAFGSSGNARAARERFGRQITGLGASLDVVSDGGLYKLQAGPWPTHEAALAAAERVRAMTELKPFTMQR